jgi:hypothetical protein
MTRNIVCADCWRLLATYDDRWQEPPAIPAHECRAQRRRTRATARRMSVTERREGPR